MRSLAWILIGTSALSCGDEPSIVTLPPDLGTNAILAVQDLDAETWDLRTLESVEGVTRLVSTQQAFLIEFSGPLELASDRRIDRSDLYRGACVLLDPQRFHRLEGEFGVVGIDVVPEALIGIVRALARPKCERCPTFDEAPIALSRSPVGVGSQVTDLEVLGPDRVLALTPEGAALVSSAGELGWFEGCERTYREAVVLPGGRVFATEGELVDEVALDALALSCEVLSSTRTPYRLIREIVGTVKGGEAVLYGLDLGEAGVGFRLDEAGFTAVVRFEVNPIVRNGSPGLIYDPERGPVYSEGRDRVHVEIDGVLEASVVKREGFEFLGLSSVEAFGVLVFLEQHQAVEAMWLAPDARTFVGLTPFLRQDLRVVVPFRGGFLGRSISGGTNEYHHDSGLCPSRDLTAPGTDRAASLMVRDEDENIFSSLEQARRPGEPVLHWMRPRLWPAPGPDVFP